MSMPIINLACFLPICIVATMKHGYAYKANPAPLYEAGAERMWYDADGKRLERAKMMEVGQLRRGDTLLLLSLHNLAGSPPAYDRWRDDLTARGVILQMVANDAPPRPVGRPVGYQPNRHDWAIWVDGHRSEKDRLAAIGGGVTRQTLNGRYGNPTNPKPAPTTEG